MCNLCSDSHAERENARKNMFYQAEQLEELARLYRLVGKGTINPHTDIAMPIRLQARTVLRELIEWI